MVSLIDTVHAELKERGFRVEQELSHRANVRVYL